MLSANCVFPFSLFLISLSLPLSKYVAIYFMLACCVTFAAAIANAGTEVAKDLKKVCQSNPKTNSRNAQSICMVQLQWAGAMHVLSKFTLKLVHVRLNTQVQAELMESEERKAYDANKEDAASKKKFMVISPYSQRELSARLVCLRTCSYVSFIFFLSSSFVCLLPLLRLFLCCCCQSFI